MVKLGQKGVAPLLVLAIVLASTGAAVATPVVVDAVGVDPDSPLYGLGRLGERIRMASGEEQMMKRWGEYSRMVAKGRGLEYQQILEEFRERMQAVAFSDLEPKAEVVRWMQEQMPGIGLVKLQLARDFSNQAKDFVAGIPGAREEIENLIEILNDLKNQFLNATPEMRENILARLRLITEQLQNVLRQLGAPLPKGLNRYFHIDNMLCEVDVNVNVRVNAEKWWPRPDNAENVYNEKLSEINELFAEIQAKLDGTPENAPGREAAKRLHELAGEAIDDANEAANADNYKKAVFLLHKAWVHLQDADRILEHAAEWEQKFSQQWKAWKSGWENMKQRWIDNGMWPHIVRNYQQNQRRIMEEWKEQWKNVQRGLRPPSFMGPND